MFQVTSIVSTNSTSAIVLCSLIYDPSTLRACCTEQISFESFTAKCQWFWPAKNDIWKKKSCKLYSIVYFTPAICVCNDTLITADFFYCERLRKNTFLTIAIDIDIMSKSTYDTRARKTWHRSQFLFTLAYILTHHHTMTKMFVNTRCSSLPSIK